MSKHTPEPANTRLAAAAPAMFRALEMVMEWWTEHQNDSMPSGDGDYCNVYDDDPPMVVAARAALSLALGSTQKQDD